MKKNNWLMPVIFLLFNQDSNLDKQDQNLLCCHYTIEQYNRFILTAQK